MSSKTFSRLVVPALFVFLASLPGFASSQVRIVRLSYVEGGVQIDRASGKYDKAFLNLPITEGTKLRTEGDGRAEVEFEDGSTLRVVPGSLIKFPQLSLDSGNKLSTIEVVEGTAYVNFVGSKSDQMTLEFAHEKIVLSHAAHLRIGIGNEGTSVAVLKGDVLVDGLSGQSEVKKNQTAEFDFANNEHLALVKDVEDQPYDAWDKQQSQYHDRYGANSYSNYSSSNYGLADLNYYGNFFSAPGYGMVWQPYFVGAGWDPFMDGLWSFEPGFGFGWVSAYPWGWAPYHSGSWVFLPGYGWAWQPGGAWTNFYTPRVLNPPSGFSTPRPPVNGTSTLVVNRGPAPVSIGENGNKTIIRSNSAGLGVPRGEISNLSRVSQQVQVRGTVTEHTHPAPVSMSAPPRGGMGDEMRGPSSRMPQRSMSPPPAPPMGRSAPPSAPSPHK